MASLLVSPSGSLEVVLNDGELASKETEYYKLIKKKGKIIMFISQMEILMFRLIDLPWSCAACH